MDIKKKLIEFYNLNAEKRENTEKSIWKLELREKFMKMALDRELTEILEIGAGTGKDSMYFQTGGMDVTCIDLSPGHVEYCLEKGLNARVMDFYKLDFPDGSFDAVYALNCLLHVPFDELDIVLKEIKRVLKKDSIVFIGNYGGFEMEEERETPNGQGKRFFSFSGFGRYKSKLSEAGFEIIEAGELRPSDDICFNYFYMGKRLSDETC